jgi:hypothetical protein
MELKLIPICNAISHKMEESDYLLVNDIPCNICNEDISYYRCKNCEYTLCNRCQMEIVDESKRLINNIQSEVGDKYQIIYYKNTGNIYLHDPIKKTTKKYNSMKSTESMSCNRNRIRKCFNNIIY